MTIEKGKRGPNVIDIEPERNENEEYFDEDDIYGRDE